ncbi:hypothetical protein [Paenibacillus spongiae]|uniref:STAS domain-containing protein n=1 Tax=Paenibacillus spongiae TaxID=2909671 RepID=A0ABY5SJR3_9BACL|nr:hypothetical protein [Paenibacillus spongiae]UVI32937.1 hypothetical protein L1F29_14350 [Paenibacillus spongiae]
MLSFQAALESRIVTLLGDLLRRQKIRIRLLLLRLRAGAAVGSIRFLDQIIAAANAQHINVWLFGQEEQILFGCSILILFRIFISANFQFGCRVDLERIRFTIAQEKLVSLDS